MRGGFEVVLRVEEGREVNGVGREKEIEDGRIP